MTSNKLLEEQLDDALGWREGGEFFYFLSKLIRTHDDSASTVVSRVIYSKCAGSCFIIPDWILFPPQGAVEKSHVDWRSRK